MKTILFYFVLSLPLFFGGCNTEYSYLKEQQSISTIWVLKNTIGGIAGNNENFNTGAIVWNFNETTHVLSVSNKVNTAESGIPSGTYSYELKKEETFYILEIKQLNVVFSRLIVDFLGEDQMIIKDEAVADGFQYTFVKNCDSTIFCTLDVKAGLNVKVRLGDSNSLITEGITVMAKSGNYSELLLPFPDKENPYFAGAYEKAGIYTVTVTKSGYQTYVSNLITVSSDCCHVIPQTLDVVLQPN
jgi:hypothetical protein